MTSPLPPKRRDSRGTSNLIRQDRTRLDQIDHGLVRGKFPPARLVKPIWSDDGEDDDPPEDTIFGEDGDRHTCFGAGFQRFVLSHIPLEETVHLFWHASADRAGVKWENEEHYTVDYERGAITIPAFTRAGEVWPKPGHVFSAQYLWIETADDAEQAGGTSLLGTWTVLSYETPTNRTINTGLTLEAGREYLLMFSDNYAVDGTFVHLPEFPAVGVWNGPAGASGFTEPQADSVNVFRRAPSEGDQWVGAWGASNPVQYSRDATEGWHAWGSNPSPNFWYSGGFLMGDPAGHSSDIIVGTGDVLQFRFLDAYTGDNNGSMTLEVYSV